MLKKKKKEETESFYTKCWNICTLDNSLTFVFAVVLHDAAQPKWATTPQTPRSQCWSFLLDTEAKCVNGTECHSWKVKSSDERLIRLVTAWQEVAEVTWLGK